MLRATDFSFPKFTLFNATEHLNFEQRVGRESLAVG